MEIACRYSRSPVVRNRREVTGVASDRSVKVRAVSSFWYASRIL